MAGDEEILWELSADGEGVLAALDEIDAGLQSMQEQIDQVAASAESLTSLDDVLSSISGLTTTLDADLSNLDSIMQALVSEVSGVSSALSELAAAMAETAASEEEVGAGADAAAEQLSLLQQASEAVSGAMDTLQAAAGPLMMIAGAAAMAGGAMVQTGMQAQDSFSLAQRMAGATSQDMQTLEQHALSLGVGMKQAGDSFYYIESAGYSGSDAIKVFDDTTKAAKAGATDAMTVSNALTASLHAYSVGADQAGKYTDMMVETVVQGKQSFSDFASAIGPLASTAHQTGVSFKEVAAAEATMTQINPHVRQDATDISHLMNAMGLNIDQTAANAKKMGINFDETAYKTMDFGQRLDYLREITYNNDTAFSKLTGGVAGLSAADDILGNSSAEIKNLMSQLDGPMSQVAATAGQLGLKFNEAQFRSMDLQGQLGYLEKVTGGNKTQMGQLVGGSKNLGDALDLLSGKSDVYAHNLSAIGNSSGATDRAFKASEQTMSASLDHLSAAFSDLSLKVVDALGPKIKPIIDGASSAIGQFASLLTNHFDQAIPIITGVATALGGVLVAAIIAFIYPMLVAVAPVLAVVAALGLLAAGIAYLVTHWQQASQAMQSFGNIPVVHQLLKTFQDMGAYLASVFGPVIKQLEATFKTQLEPSLTQLWQALQRAAPFFEALGVVIGGALVVALGLLVSIITGLIKAFASLLTGAIQAFGGIVQMASGFVQMILGILMILFDSILALFTGNWSKVGKDTQTFLTGFITFWVGFGNTFMGIVGGILETIWNFFVGFIEGIIGYFTHLYDVLIGHSIIPDMMNGILDWFTKLYEQATSSVSNLINKISSFFSGLATTARTWATDMIQGFLDGLASMGSQLEAGVQNVAGTIAKFLHFSKPEAGPLAHADQWMPDMVQMLTDTLHAQTNKLGSASLSVATHIAQLGGAAGSSPGTPGGGGGLSTALLSQIVSLLQQQRQQVSLGPAPEQINRGAIVQQFGNVNFQGVQDIQTLYQALNQLGGISNEYGLRGVTSGI